MWLKGELTKCQTYGWILLQKNPDERICFWSPSARDAERGPHDHRPQEPHPRGQQDGAVRPGQPPPGVQRLLRRVRVRAGLHDGSGPFIGLFIVVFILYRAEVVYEYNNSL